MAQVDECMNATNGKRTDLSAYVRWLNEVDGVIVRVERDHLTAFALLFSSLKWATKPHIVFRKVDMTVLLNFKP